MGFLDDILDWAADKVQTVTGEKERRQRVLEFKKAHRDFKDETIVLIEELNAEISIFNEKINNLNILRAEDIKRNIDNLGIFLGGFGGLQENSKYIDESNKNTESLPEKSFARNEDYISEIDWSKGDIFADTFFLSPLGMKYKTNKQTVSMIEKLKLLKIEAVHVSMELGQKKDRAKLDAEICDFYIECIQFIIEYIEKNILPELELVEAFFQAQKINEELICDKKLVDISFKNDIESIKGTVYFKHYLFVRNTFVFYIIAYNIYKTPVLTKLLNNSTETTKEDLLLLKKQDEALKIQSARLEELVLVKSV